ncbi:MAG: GHMP family kinase ATP-binding protein [bacterium]
MIISRTPLRISFIGGGSDIREYYKHRQGAVVSTAIKKHMYVTVNKRFDDTIRVSYSKTEIVKNLEELQHELVREAMRLVRIEKGVEITTISDVPAGTGLGSSSSLTVGLLNALYAYKGIMASPKRLAKEACQIEIDILNSPIGKQDQYIAAFGGIEHIRFNPDETVFVDPVILKPELRRELNEHLSLFYIGLKTEGHTILKSIKKNTRNKFKILNQMVELANELPDILNKGDFDGFGAILNKGWELKKKLAKGISDERIDNIYDRAIKAGALGGKILGEGGGGFLLLTFPPEKRLAIKAAIPECKEFPFKLDPQGSKIIYVEEEQ